MSVVSKSAIFAVATIFLLAPVSSSFAMSEADCENLWQKADTDGDGTLSKHEDPKWEQRINHMSNITKKDQEIIHKPEFMKSCTDGEMDGL